MSKWYTKHRLDWIAETVRIFGFINRKHLQKKFGISTPQASVDLRAFQKMYPRTIIYNPTLKQYELAKGAKEIA